ncbi:hypothetical protein PR202_ga03306 [Eleusine coracana subsp. coracana]|uniref:Uncharacterized protein n=1 Tax=Eleusine coracana subsp. coracana TaxID=191504 RepID=A0AAV5BLS2_ELECO|nr:hypothetical protein PR202_ga03306 [Eleusine coracana subsp. coracana]
MDAYDDEEDGLEIFSSGMGDLYYPSNDMDPYLKKNDGVEEDEDEEEVEDNIIKPSDFVLVCAHSEDDVYSLQASTR